LSRSAHPLQAIAMAKATANRLVIRGSNVPAAPKSDAVSESCHYIGRLPDLAAATSVTAEQTPRKRQGEARSVGAPICVRMGFLRVPAWKTMCHKNV
jgi:hypothetical protein